ncbi:MAG TPA: hypothetical protein VGO93_00565 [Candidatus Xenobia bacterium]|jgi:hypothetical protein
MSPQPMRSDSVDDPIVYTKQQGALMWPVGFVDANGCVWIDSARCVTRTPCYTLYECVSETGETWWLRRTRGEGCGWEVSRRPPLQVLHGGRS